MDKKLVLSLGGLIAALVVAGATAWGMGGAVRTVDILVLFFSGAGTGAAVVATVSSFRGRTIRVRIPATQTASEGRSRGPRERRGRGGRTRAPVRDKKKAQRATGTVKWFDATKGYGFLTPDSGAEDCFVHRSAIKGGQALDEGTKVAFEIITDDKGRRAAANVVKR